MTLGLSFSIQLIMLAYCKIKILTRVWLCMAKNAQAIMLLATPDNKIDLVVLVSVGEISIFEIDLDLS